MSLLDVRALSVSFGAEEVVHSVSFRIAMGEKLALVGESGSGKTVTALSLLGLAQGARATGQALWAGPSDGAVADLLSMGDKQLQALRGQDIAMVFQEPMTALNPVFTIGEQIAEVLQLKMGLDRIQAWQGAIQLIADTGISEPERRAGSFPHQLSGGQRQRAMIAMALACKPRLLLADEPTTALDVTVRKQILDLLSDLQTRYGMAVLLITHDLNLVRRFADRVAVMERGTVVEQGGVQEVFDAPAHPYTRRLIASRPVRDIVPASTGRSVLTARELGVRYPVPRPGWRGWFSDGFFVALRDASFELTAGQTLGVVGESGSGKSTLALAALGLVRSGGTLEISGKRWGQGVQSDLAMRKELQVVFQDPFSSLSPRMTVLEIVGEGLVVHSPELPTAQRVLQVQAALAEVGLEESQFPGLLQRYPHQFSGGQRQRIAIARALIVKPALLVLDEPTSALDVTMAQQILRLLQGLQKSHGLSYLLITHDVEVVQAMAHRVIVMKDGEIVESGATETVFAAPTHEYTRALLAAAQ